MSGSVADTRSEVCWAAVTHDGRFAYVTNFGDETISSYAIADDGSLELLDAVAGSACLGERPSATRRHARRTLPVRDRAEGEKVFGWTIGSDGRLASIGALAGVPETVAGLAASRRRPASRSSRRLRIPLP